MSRQAWKVSWIVCALVVMPGRAVPQSSALPAIVVAGSAQLRVPADSATLRVTWFLRNGEAAAQRSEDASALDSLRALLRNAGVEDVTLRHAGDEWYDLLGGTRGGAQGQKHPRQASFEVLGEAAIASVLAGLRNHPIFAEVRPDYGCRCADSLEGLALAIAFERARGRAMAVAAAAGMRLAAITTVSTQPLYAGPGGGPGAAVEYDGRALDETMVYLRPAGYGTLPPPLAAPFVTVDATVFVSWRVERR